MNAQEVQKLPFDVKKIFQISSDQQFVDYALQIFEFQYDNNPVYQEFVNHLKVNPSEIKQIADIPFLPISFFKTHEVKSTAIEAAVVFESSGTTGQLRSRHFVPDTGLYELSFLKGFEHFYGPIDDYIIMGLLPSYHENEHSSLIYMVDHLINWSAHPASGFFLNDQERLIKTVNRYRKEKKILIIGVSYALLDLAEKFQPDLSDCIVMETGGMKGRRKELTKNELHNKLKEGLSLSSVHSEYGMTELLSQAYSKADGLFNCPPWMRVIIREQSDPLNLISKRSGGINVIDLANIYSCSFIATEDLGKSMEQQFEVLGRFDTADIRGCNLLIQ